MNKYEKLRAIVLIIGVVVVLFVIIIGGMIVIPKDERLKLPKCNTISVYNALVGEEIPFKELEEYPKTCYIDNLYYQTTSYSKEPSYLVLYINVIKKEHHNWLSLDNKIIGKTNIKLEDAIKNGTKYSYTFIKNGNNYILNSIELQ